MRRKVIKMKSNAKAKLIILIALGILFAFSPVFTTNLSFITGNSNKISDNIINFCNKGNLKTSQHYVNYSENFDDGLADNWQSIGGTWIVENKKYKVTGAPGERVRCYYNKHSFFNYTYEGDFNLVSGNELQLIFNIQDMYSGVDQGHYCQITLFYDDPYGRKDTVVLYSTQNGQTEHTNVAYDFTHNNWYHFSIISTGDNVDFFLNNSLILSYSGLFYSSGYIGVKSMYGPTAYWDNITVSGIGIPLIYKFTIYGNSGWSAVKSAGICTGEGTYSNPYVIEDLEIDGGGSGSCIEIRSSNVFFIIENCSLYNSGGIGYGDAGIRLYNVENGILSQNNCSNNKFGISILESCENILVQGNIISGSTESGIYLVYSYSNYIKENLIINSGDEGMLLIDGFYNKILNNTINFNARVGIQLQGISNNNNISGNYISGSSVGIFLSASTYCNTVTNNIFSNNGEDIQNFQRVCSPVENVLGIVIPIAIVAVVITGVLVIKRNKARKSRLPKDEVARYYKLKEQKIRVMEVLEEKEKTVPVKIKPTKSTVEQILLKEESIKQVVKEPISPEVLEEKEKPLPVKIEPSQPKILNCVFCGTEVDAERNFCQRCGQKLKKS